MVDLFVEYADPERDEQAEFYAWAYLQEAIKDVIEAAKHDKAVYDRLVEALKGVKHE